MCDLFNNLLRWRAFNADCASRQPPTNRAVPV